VIAESTTTNCCVGALSSLLEGFVQACVSLYQPATIDSTAGHIAVYLIQEILSSHDILGLLCHAFLSHFLSHSLHGLGFLGVMLGKDVFY